MNRLIARQQEKLRNGDKGFTLIELLVVISILGILAAITVFSVAGLGDRGKAAAVAIDEQTVRTAEEAYFASPTLGNGLYATDIATLVTAGLLSTGSTYNSKVAVSADSKSYYTAGNFNAVGAAYTGTGALFLGASNTTTPFNFALPDFIYKSSFAVGTPTYGSSSTLASTANAGGASVLFASADEANVNATILTTDTTSGSPGTCSGTCAGIGNTKAQYTTGRLVVYSCKSGGIRIPSGGCPAPGAGYLDGVTPHPAAPTTVAEAIQVLRGSQSPAYPTPPTSCSRKLAIADPGTLPPGATPPTAPYGVAAYQALLASGMTSGEYSAMVTAGCITNPSNVTNTMNAVTGGTVDMALVPKSFVVAPGQVDTDNWTTVPSALHSPIKQWAVVLNHSTAAERATAQAFIAYLLSPIGRGVMSAYGYDPVS